MVNNVITIPHGVMRVLNCDWDIDWRSQSAGEGAEGSEQIFLQPFPRWIGTPQLILHGEAIRLWRATRAKARGRANVYRVPLLEKSNLPNAYGQADSRGRPLNGNYGDGPTVPLVNAAAPGATSIVVTETFHRAGIGRYISIADWPYLVVDRQRVGPGSANWILTIEMPLRRAAAAGATVNLIAHGLFRAREDTMGNPEVGLGDVSTPQLSFAEWINRP
ncbi:hypothetical protein [Paracoccus laeviglucosivorans]|uniref:Uncharacterized protein n=1 Tax=Paracoccus laeviglucosivorans TaxID=1197861 RepID=A0A521CXC1_9RHOB|nr:hypothetical protein [Paracoccus laeviglucosivorans]SMO64093.1 hypothetical protein SAMN06265221_105248 [Paracoccus laeviglucosivorans]